MKVIMLLGFLVLVLVCSCSNDLVVALEAKVRADAIELCEQGDEQACEWLEDHPE